MSLSVKNTLVIKRDKTFARPAHYELEQRCTQALLTILPQMRQIISRESDESITVQQYSVLKALKDQKRLISELADLLKVSRPTMSRIVDGLEGRRRATDEPKRPKLVEREFCENDHRLVYACITPEGLEILLNYRAQAEESVMVLLREISPDDLPVLLHSLEMLARVVETHD